MEVEHEYHSLSSLNISISILNLFLQGLMLFDFLPQDEVDQLGELPNWDKTFSLWVKLRPELVEFVKGVLGNL